jgi:hypothetical protein
MNGPDMPIAESNKCTNVRPPLGALSVGASRVAVK